MSLDDELIWAAQRGDLNRCCELIKAGADVNAKDEDGITVLMRVAAECIIPADCRKLIAAGADVFAKDNEGRTVLHYARGYDITRWFADEYGLDVNAKDNNGDTPILILLRTGTLEVCKWAIGEKGTDVNVRYKVSSYGKEVSETPLLSAAKHGHKDACEWLLENGADINATDESGKEQAFRRRRILNQSRCGPQCEE